jgi:hypothetical protein
MINVEQLPERAAPANLSIAGTLLTVAAHKLGDHVLVTPHGDGAIDVTTSTRHFTVPRAGVESLALIGSAAPDWLINLTDVPAVIQGKGGKDVLIGGPAGDKVFADRKDFSFSLAFDVGGVSASVAASISLPGLDDFGPFNVGAFDL